MKRSIKRRMLVIFGCVLLCACGKEAPVGEVAIKVARGFVLPTLGIRKVEWLSEDPKLFTPNPDGTPVILHRNPDSFDLVYKNQPSERWNTACTFRIKENRVITITVRMVNRDAKCETVE